jgi:hypothetical protein
VNVCKDFGVSPFAAAAERDDVFNLATDIALDFKQFERQRWPTRNGLAPWACHRVEARSLALQLQTVTVRNQLVFQVWWPGGENQFQTIQASIVVQVSS